MLYRLQTTDVHVSVADFNDYWISSEDVSVKTEADFCPPAGAGAPAHKSQGPPAGDEAPVTPLLHPEAPVAPGASGNCQRIEE